MNTTEEKKSEVALREEAVLTFWKEHDIFNKSLKTPAGSAPKGDFVFYDGPPFATGLPHYGHILAGTIKDAIPRFWTMQGYRVRRTWGWDCHGLPLENLIEKKLGLATKRDIEEYGVQNFNEAARDAVMEYADDWREIIPRMGRFVDMENDYKTMDSTYTESVWWVFKSLFEKGLVYEGFKSMHLCPRCGTTLSNFEVNQGYKDIKDIAVTVKLPLLDDVGNVTDTSLLVWTTTPWTLPGNMAAAVHEDIEYVKVSVHIGEGEIRSVGSNEQPQNQPMRDTVILAKERLSMLVGMSFDILEEFKGADLVGKSYKPPFDYWKNRSKMDGPNWTDEFDNAWKIYHADYVELGDEGTGAVHLAPAYGDDDMKLAQAHNVPIVHHVDNEGHFMDFVADFKGQLVKPKDDDEAGVTHLDADIEIVKALKEKGVLFKKENITHSYPHCWRCDTPLLNYATTSWFVAVTEIKDQLVAENKKVHWVPEHVGTARFGKWLEGARDWAISRQRYWGAPLPIWRNPKTQEIHVFGSIAELQAYVPKSGNTYFTMRHGESEKNVIKVVTDAPDAPYPLTEKGIEDVKRAALALKGTIDLIFTSPVLRARDTAALMATELGLDESAVIVDDRIRETQHGIYEGKPLAEYKAAYPTGLSKFTEKPEGGENWSDLRKRTGAFMYALEEQYENKRILIVSHGDPLAMLHASAAGMSREETAALYSETYPEKGVAREVPFVPVPHNDEYVLDFHRPYIDDVVLVDRDGTKLERVPDVFDCWFESGSMPYGQNHYPFENKDVFDAQNDKGFPADFIAESIDQTRGWFYSTMVLGVALFGKSPYENVITNGLVLAEDGRKMSKSLQNYPDPVELVNRQGADAMRFYLLSSSIIKGEDLNFSEKEVMELQRKNIGRLNNVLTMYEMFADEGVESRRDSTQVLDRWIISRLNELLTQVTEGYRNYELDKATRPITDFIDDLSVWYLRRSRDRLKGDDVEDATLALSTLRHVLYTLSQVMAPVMPFFAEHLFQGVKVKNDVESVHLTAWPEGGTVDTELVSEMERVREVVTAALEQRAKENIKVRQPLARLTSKVSFTDAAFEALVMDEVNVKEFVTNEHLNQLVEFDTAITPELQAEGDARDLMRAVQDMRKKAGLAASDRIVLNVQTSDEGEAIVKTFQADIEKTVGADEIVFGDATGTDITAGQHSFTIEIQKVG